jgi:uncharacterized protein DUF547
MRKTVLLSATVLIAASSVAYLACSGQSRQVVVNKDVRDYAGGPDRAVPLDRVDHSTWDRLLQKYVDQDGMVDYTAWKASKSDREALKEYLATLSAADADARTTKQGKLAYWINAYNALTVQGILDVYPTSSIRNHTAKLIGYNIWDDLLLPVGNQKYSLNQIEHKILRKLGEPRIHFAIVCASIGCPRLLNEAYTPEHLESQLAKNTRDFFARRRNFQVDLASRKVRVSSILDWFGEDFAPTPRKALARLAKYVPDAATRELLASADFSVSYLDYNWSLNKQ